MLQEIKPSLSCTDSIKQVSLFNSNAKGRSKASWLAGFSSNRASRKKCAKSCGFADDGYFWFLQDSSAQWYCSSVCLAPLKTHRCFPWSRERGNCKRQFCSGILAFAWETKPLWFQKRRNVPWLYAGRKAIRWETSLSLHSPLLQKKKISS